MMSRRRWTASGQLTTGGADSTGVVLWRQPGVVWQPWRPGRRISQYRKASPGYCDLFLAFAGGGVELAFAKTQAFWRDFQQFVVFDEIQALLQAKDGRRGQLH